jgi:hypothetical protein
MTSDDSLRIPADDLRRVFEFAIGQVSESWSYLREMLDDQSKTLGYGFVWLAEVLRVVGAENVG